MPFEGQFPYLYEGSVTKRDDPEGLSRIKLSIPGMVEPETPKWVWPIGISGGGTAHRGHFEPPAVGANVAVLFVMGNPEEPRYLIGPWGAPSGTSDTPSEATVEGDDKQNAVTEDEEWLIQRDSRSSSKRYVIRHKASSLALFLDADNDKVFLVRETANQALVRGTEYRAAEVSAMSSLLAITDAIVAALGAVGADPTFSGSFPTAAGFLATLATTTYPSVKSAFSSTDFANNANSFLSAKANTE